MKKKILIILFLSPVLLLGQNIEKSDSVASVGAVLAQGFDAGGELVAQYQVDFSSANMTIKQMREKLIEEMNPPLSEGVYESIPIWEAYKNEHRYDLNYVRWRITVAGLKNELFEYLAKPSISQLNDIFYDELEYYVEKIRKKQSDPEKAKRNFADRVANRVIQIYSQTVFDFLDRREGDWYSASMSNQDPQNSNFEENDKKIILDHYSTASRFEKIAYEHFFSGDYAQTIVYVQELLIDSGLVPRPWMYELLHLSFQGVASELQKGSKRHKLAEKKSKYYKKKLTALIR